MPQVRHVSGKLYEFTKADHEKLALKHWKEGIEAEERGDAREELRIYIRGLIYDPYNKDLLVNVGTIFYNRDKLFIAEWCYRRAAVANPEYALAHFDLGNTLDEFAGRAQEVYAKKWGFADPIRSIPPKRHRAPEADRLRKEAIECYLRAIAIDPAYADAHYNLALAYNKLGRLREATKHFRVYRECDLRGPWNSYASQMVQALEARDLKVVGR